MRILHIIYTSGIYGAEKYLLNLLPELKKYDVQCELIFICPEGSTLYLQEYCDLMNTKGVKTAFVTTRSKVSVLFTARKIFHYLKSNNINILHSHLFSADLIAVLIKKIYFKKLTILSTKHGYEEKYLVQYGLGNKDIRFNLYYLISRIVSKNIDHNFAVSKAVAEMYHHLRLGGNKMKYIHHGINPPSLTPNPAKVEGNPKIIIVGRLTKMKGHEYLIKAIPRIIQEFPQLKLVVLGGGPLKSELEKMAMSLKVSQHIDFLGFASPNSYLSQCQVMILPSLFEPFGLVYIESFASRIPIVAFDTQAANEIIENNETGILVAKENIEELAEKIIYLLKNTDERTRLTENAYKKFQDHYNADRMVKQTADWYHSVLQSSK